MSRSITLVLLGCFLLAEPVGAQPAPDRDAILAAVDRFFAGMRARDTAMMSSVTMPGATMAYAAYRGGKPNIGGATAADQHVIVARMAEAPDERVLAAEVWQDGDIATVWAPYEISLGTKLLHCGYDGFNFVRVNGVWQFSSALYTARPEDCPAIRAAAKGKPREPGAADRKAVLEAVEGFFTAMRSRDSAGLANSFTSRASWAIANYRDGKLVVSRRLASLDVDRMSRSTQSLDERFLAEPIVRVDGDVALVWGYYQFKVDGKVTHCGYDSFHMLRENGVWRLEAGAFTVRPAGCPK